MQRIPCPERDDWRQTAQQCGFDFCEVDGERYWDERAYYAFSLAEIEHGIEEPTAEIEQICLELVARVVADETLLRRLQIPQAVWPFLSESWERRDGSLYGRLDLSFQGFRDGGRAPAKLLEYNADTPTSIFEAAVFQWTWLEQAIERRIVPGRADQYNSIHERLIARWRTLGEGRRLHLAGLMEDAEDGATLAYLADTAAQAGLSTSLLDISEIGWRDTGGGFVDLDTNDIALAFKLYPWEWMFHDAFGAKLAGAPTQWIEPPWKAILSNKGILPLLWQMFEGHPNLLPAYFEDDPKAASLGPSFVRKPIYSREGANVSLVSDGVSVSAQDGPYGAEGFIRQGLAPLPDFGGVFPVIGSWLVAHEPCGLSIREDASPITGNRSRFLPHAIL
ncbi:Putative Glutathionylspermidine synthase family protein [Bradyrhizobium sp. ORS 278]|uniref:glutathionylspermidine synthase family protein n=1 Tax=Bradyrhizobium sp. (strain ORS 278) TaxID=114615 RepID=UPI0001507A47|nr:glutathionylspermidine synthase family protein [Bradyrhizobium sp. ORS 278]CAL75373.1 Putative Glutathionylspermidine synthase family protein [Bradyrhizobium sp. ORS 278]